MSRNYSIRNFLRNTPNYLIKQYLDASNVEIDVDFEQLKETKIKPLFEAITALEEGEAQQQTNSDFQSVFQMSLQGGIKRILQTASFRGVDLEPTFEKMKGFPEKALYTFLNHNDIYNAAQIFACTDYLPGRYWRKIKNIKPFVEPDYESKKDILADGISSYFKKAEGRGKSCEVDYYKQGTQHYYFCYPEDYSRTELLWENGNFERPFSSPAFEVIFVYDSATETLDSFFGGNVKIDKILKEVFVLAVLGLDELPEKEEVVYDLSVIKSPTFEFKRPANSKIKKVEIKGLRFLTTKRTIVVTETIAKESVQAVLNDIAIHNPSIKMSSDSINQVTIKATLEADNRKGETYRTFNITYPGTCNLKYDENDSILRQMIIDSGIESQPEQEQKVA